jgi:hypothetical protein
MDAVMILKTVVLFAIGVMISKWIRWCVKQSVRNTVRDELKKTGRK